jgi:uncharacterized protein (TIGR00299 family) protein
MSRKVLHFDCFSGLAGDMFLGACLELGVPIGLIEASVAALDLEHVALEVSSGRRGGLAGTRFRVLVGGHSTEGPEPGEHGHGQGAGQGAGGHHGAPPHVHGRSLAAIGECIAGGALEPEVRDLALRLFERLGEAEARVHGVALEEVHFHEVGAVDAIVDIVGAATAMCHLRPDLVTCGPINVGSGSVETAHGTLPVPAPATARLLEGLPIYSTGEGEMLTPTGAVLLAELVDEFRELPAMRLEAVAHGLGRREVPGRANLFRLLSGRSESSADDDGAEGEVMVLETTLDDATGELLGALQGRLLAAGALDVFLAPVQMKKARPGTNVTVLCRRAELESLAGDLLEETGSLGCRYHPVGRFEAERWTSTVGTVYGEVRVKRGRFRGREITSAPEADDCARRAREAGVSWREVYRAASDAARQPAPSDDD